MAGEICMSGEVIGARVKFEVNHRIYQGEVKMLSDGTMTAVGDFKPVGNDEPEYREQRFQSKPETDRAINHSIAVLFAEKSGSKDILDPVWLDIGCVSVATAYHPKCGKVTILVEPCLSNGGDGSGYNITGFAKEFHLDSQAPTLLQAKAKTSEAWSEFCAQHEPTIKPAPEWLQIKSVWVCEHNGWASCLLPSAAVSNNGENPIQLYVCESWKIDDMRKKRYSAPSPLRDAKRFVFWPG